MSRPAGFADSPLAPEAADSGNAQGIPRPVLNEVEGPAPA
jgi:hypothetical protein